MYTLTQNLHAAVANGKLELLRQVLETVPVDVQDERGRTALMQACRAGRAEIVELLLAAGAQVNATNHQGTTPLMYAKTAAMGNGNLAVLRLLLAKGADINARDRAGRTALEYAVTNAAAVIEFLKSEGAQR
jgi:ankyrin repeat protein